MMLPYEAVHIGEPPPNMRIVECCETCKHVEFHYEGERTCSKHRFRYEWDEPDDETQPLYVSQNDICDDHDPRAPREEAERG